MSIKFKISRDPALLGEYYALRERCFRSELDLPDFDGSEEEQDRHGHILLALYEGRCIGGARISSHIAWPSQVEALALEQDTCCMWERLGIEPKVRSLQLLREFCANLVCASAALGYKHAMVLSSLKNARFYRQCHSALGVDFQIHRPVPHCAEGSFAGLEHYLSIAHLDEGIATRQAVAVQA